MEGMHKQDPGMRLLFQIGFIGRWESALTMWHSGVGKKPPERLLELLLVEVKEIEKSPTPQFLSSTTSSDATLELCKYWLHTCRTTHEKCGHWESGSRFLPSRLVKVISIGGIVKARLVSGAHAPRDTRYLTLSHCWGRTPFLTLLTQNIAQFKQNIPVNVLQRSFQDALSMTLKLGFKYIWIDSLCIIQDKLEDWISESSRMDRVYKHSACNIAATGSADGQHGIFVERDPSQLIWPLVEAEWAGVWFNARPRAGRYYLVNCDLWDDEVSNAPLNRRGWVLQERLLSPAVLHFGARQIFWECFETYKCEVHPFGLPLAMSTPILFKSINFYNRHVSQTGDSDTRQETSDEDMPEELLPRKRQRIYLSWNQIVSAYSAGNLTKSADKLVAISGAAKEVRQILGDRYLAGLWEKNIMRDLLWVPRTRGEADSVDLPVGFRAPSWSWASVDAKVSYHTGIELTKVYTTLVQAHIDVASEDDTTLLRGGYLRLRGPLVKVTPKDDYQDVYRNRWNLAGLRLCVEFDLAVLPRQKKQDFPLRLKQDHEGVLSISIGSRFFKKRMIQDEFYLLPILRDKLSRDADCGLLLRLTGVASGEYIRVGHFQAEKGEIEDRLFASAEPLLESCYETCDTSTKPIQYTIKII